MHQVCSILATRGPCEDAHGFRHPAQAHLLVVDRDFGVHFLQDGQPLGTIYGCVCEHELVERLIRNVCVYSDHCWDSTNEYFDSSDILVVDFLRQEQFLDPVRVFSQC